MASSAPNSNNASSAGAVNSLLGAVSAVKEGWEKSGASAAVTNMSASIPQGTKDYLQQTSKQLFNRDALRSVTVFFGIGEERPFYVERAPSLLVERLRHNVTYFYLNYMLLFASLFVMTLVVSPSAIIGIALLAAAWMYVIRSSESGSLKIFGFSITQKQATIVMSLLSVVVLLYLLSNVFWWTLASGGFLVGVHAFLRDASLHRDEGDKVVMQGDLTFTGTGENASFLNEEPVV